MKKISAIGLGAAAVAALAACSSSTTDDPFDYDSYGECKASSYIWIQTGDSIVTDGYCIKPGTPGVAGDGPQIVGQGPGDLEQNGPRDRGT